MGKSKQTKEKKFDRNVEISAPILDPEIIKAIHTPPKGQKLDIKHGGFKALLSDLNSQDSTDELTPLNDNHVPSYIGISCAVSGYSNYSSYSKKPTNESQVTTKTAITNSSSTPNRSRATSPVLHTTGPEIHHITLDRNTIHSADEERKELTQKLTASATERRRSPSPCIPPTEDDRHHGAYVGARYCPLPAPSKIVNKHIPLLGIDDEQDPNEKQEEENKVEQRIASLYGGDFVEDWRESMTHKAKKELAIDQVQAQAKSLVNPKDLVTLKPTPPPTAAANENELETKPVDVTVPNVKVLANVEKQFLNKLLTDENPPTPTKPSSPSSAPIKPTASTTSSAGTKTEEPIRIASIVDKQAEPISEATPELVQESVVNESLENVEDDNVVIESVDNNTTGQEKNNIVIDEEKGEKEEDEKLVVTRQDDIITIEPENHNSLTNRTSDEQETKDLVEQAEEKEKVLGQEEEAPMSPDSGKSQSFTEEELVIPASQSKEEHIEYEIRAQSPLDNESSPVKVAQQETSLEPTSLEADVEQEQKDSITNLEESSPITSDSKDGHYYLGLLDKEKSFILEQVAKAEKLLEKEDGDELDEDKVGRLRSAIGKANLLINKKFNQFKELCEANINKSGDEQFATLDDDLAGFWDMLSIQVSDIQKSFENLWTAHQQLSEGEMMTTTSKEAGLSGVDEDQQTIKEPKSSKPKLSAEKDQKRRERLQEHISQMKKDQAAKMSNENLLDD